MVTGFMGKNSEGYHAWNKIKIDNEWYNVDVTQEAEKLEKTGEFKYFLVSDKTLGCDAAIQENSRRNFLL